MFTKYPNVFAKVKERMKGNISIGAIKKSWFTSDRDIELLIDQVIFETLDAVEEEKLKNNQ